MKTPTHTPAPWKAAELTGNQVAVMTGDGRKIIALCQIVATSLAPNENRLSNAEFIVAAVNSHAQLVDSLKWLVECVSAAEESAEAHDWHAKDVAHALELARQALASAKGETT